MRVGRLADSSSWRTPPLSQRRSAAPRHAAPPPPLHTPTLCLSAVPSDRCLRPHPCGRNPTMPYLLYVCVLFIIALVQAVT